MSDVKIKEHLSSLRSSIDDLMKHPERGQTAIIQNGFGEYVYLDSMSVRLDLLIALVENRCQEKGDAVTFSLSKFRDTIARSKSHWYSDIHTNSEKIAFDNWNSALDNVVTFIEQEALNGYPNIGVKK